MAVLLLSTGCKMPGTVANSTKCKYSASCSPQKQRLRFMRSHWGEGDTGGGTEWNKTPLKNKTLKKSYVVDKQ
jgi:hypothetical protein